MAKGGKTGGRVSGTPNKVTSEVKEVISEVIGAYVNGSVDEGGEVISLASDLKKVDAYQRLQIFAKLTDYVLPKQKSVEHKGNRHNGVFLIGYDESVSST